jgi:methyltransferase (TIGR00027 family)
MEDGKPSVTASRVAARRALHQLIDAPVVFRDPLALSMLRADAAAAMSRDPKRFEGHRYDRMLRAFLVARSAISDASIARSVAKGVRQVVILGAGLDTFAYRHAYPGIRVFEVDHPATQAWKRRRLAERGIAVPDSLTFVPVDFERDNLRARLTDAGLDAAQPSVFSWLGVAPYLAPDDVWRTVDDIAWFTAHGGAVTFDYLARAHPLALWPRLLRWRVQQRLRRAGEPLKSAFTPSQIAEGLSRRGFTEIDDLGAAEINARFFANRADGLRTGTGGRVLTARVSR